MNSRGCSVIVRKSFRVRNELLSPPGLQQQEIGTSHAGCERRAGRIPLSLHNAGRLDGVEGRSWGHCLCFGEVALIRASGLRPFSAAELHTSACDCSFLVLLELFLHICLPSNAAINNKATSRTGEPGRVSRRGGGGELRCGKHVSI